MLIDPMLSLAMSMHSNPGVYALLLGSGVSRSAGIPTGWEVVLDLVRRLAKLEGADCEPAPEAWYKGKYGVEPTYSGLLNAVVKSQAERSQLLRGYFEPSGDEREKGLKMPTPAHHAVARLVKSGHVRVILTTNFDRLLEQAMEAAGVAPRVIASPDAVEGAIPIVHGGCTVVKLHGDYMDIRSKNTPVELDSYDPRIDQLLDRVLDEFGLIVCGWSVEWDTALRAAIERCKGRRFTTYWTVRTKVADAAKRLIDLRSAQEITVQDADSFFMGLAEKVESLSELDRPHPMSAKVAVAQTKKYLVDQKYRIQLYELFMQEVEKIVRETTHENCPVAGPFPQADYRKRIESFRILTEVGVGIISAGCFWGERVHSDIWCKGIERLANRPRPSSRNNTMQGLRSYPALVLFYGGGIAAVAKDRYDILYDLFTQPRVRDGHNSTSIIEGLFENLRPDVFKVMPGLGRKKLPLSEHLFATLRESLKDLIPDDEGYGRAFDRFEALQSLTAADTFKWAVPGAFMYRSGNRFGGGSLAEIKEEQRKMGENWTLFKVGYFGASKERWDLAIALVENMAEKVSFP